MTVWTRSKLKSYLAENNVDTSGWGKGMAKTFEHLFTELIKGECTLHVEGGKVFRDVEALSINIYYKDEQLIEEYQKMKDNGRFRRRILDCSVAEKLTKDDKDLPTAVERALEEELGIKNVTHDQVTYVKEVFRVLPNSPDYPNITMNLKLYKFNVELKYEQYHPYGYVEHQEDKDIFFTWIKRTNKPRETY